MNENLIKRILKDTILETIRLGDRAKQQPFYNIDPHLDEINKTLERKGIGLVVLSIYQQEDYSLLNINYIAKIKIKDETRKILFSIDQKEIEKSYLGFNSPNDMKIHLMESWWNMVEFLMDTSGFDKEEVKKQAKEAIDQLYS